MSFIKAQSQRLGFWLWVPITQDDVGNELTDKLEAFLEKLVTAKIFSVEYSAILAYSESAAFHT